MQDISGKISDLYNQVTATSNFEFQSSQIELIESAITMLDSGVARVAEKKGSEWVTNIWAKQAVLLYFRIAKMEVHEMGPFNFVDKIPVKRWTGQEGVRSVPLSFVRRGAFVESGVILMPSFVNIGARVGAGTMVDTWATVGSCAQIGKNVHLSGGVGIGGVLEPLQAGPVIIGDNAFVGSRCIVVEGVKVGDGAVLGAGVTLTSSTKIFDVSGSQTVEMRGEVPDNSVVIPGTTRKKFPAGEFEVPCALIIGKRQPSTDLKTSLNQALRDFQVSV
ncbi:MAG TPA: 2,3,4,5-tetrahydropyridine-2,6-dicarboxylate N-succinyltransferase [Pseudobdellovibrionaceae bacterium]|nr:2,3,4,5-tetrahydropyridine-2,6-dicarboxylate N-succinyltransferase [Pseudobdellovibrionaceae bacterium]